MSPEQLLALYDREQRIEVTYSDVRREVTPDVVRHVDVTGEEGFVIYSRLRAETAADVIREQIAYFESIGQDFEWKVYAHDSPPDLKDRLAAHGFEVEESEALLVLDLESAQAALFRPVTLDVRRITAPSGVADAISVQEQVWQEDFSGLAQRLATDLEREPGSLALYVGYQDGRPASSAWIYFHEGSQFASLWGGSTVSAARRKGFYSALLAVRAQEARERGVRFLAVDASPMSRPILERFGFQFLDSIHPCKWRSGRSGHGSGS